MVGQRLYSNKIAETPKATYIQIVDSDLREFFKCRNTFKNLCRAKCLSLERKRRSELVDCLRNPQKFWKHLKSTVKSRKTVSSVIPGVIWFDYFKTLFKDDQATNDTLHNDIFDFMSEQKDSSLDATITNEEFIN